MNTELSDPTRSLLAAAVAVRHNAHAPYSKFYVGAALLDDTGRIHVGCNVENASYGLTVCAERAAICAAIAAGATQFRALAVASHGGVPPCGACRQVLAEFADELPIWLLDAEDDAPLVCTSLHALLPMRFNG